MESNMFVVVSSDGTLYGPFASVIGAELWADGEEEMLGDWYVKEVYHA